MKAFALLSIKCLDPKHRAPRLEGTKRWAACMCVSLTSCAAAPQNMRCCLTQQTSPHCARHLHTCTPAGASCTLLAPFMQPFCQQLLSGSTIRWTSVCLDLLALLPLPPGTAAAAWTVLLTAAVTLQGPSFMPGGLV